MKVLIKKLEMSIIKFTDINNKINKVNKTKKNKKQKHYEYYGCE